jgi:hypothetical protein
MTPAARMRGVSRPCGCMTCPKRARRPRRRRVQCPSTGQESNMESVATSEPRQPWNKGKIVGQKAPFKLKDIWALRVRLQMENRVRELALFNLGIDSKLRGCDLVSLKVRDICHGEQVASRAIVVQHKPSVPCSLKSPRLHARLCKSGSSRQRGSPMTSSSQVAFMNRHTWEHGSTLGSLKGGSRTLDLTQRTTARVRCGEPRQP